MDKQDFLGQLRKKLCCLPQDDIEEHLTFYSEMIEDRREDGLSEEEAVAAVGSIEEIARQIIADTPLPGNTAKKRLTAWHIILLIVGSPVWLSLLIAAFTVVFALYISLWSVIISLWAVFASLEACAFAGIAAGIGSAFAGNGLVGIAMIGGGILCAGLGIFLFFGCRAANKGLLFLTRQLVLAIRNCFAKKEEA